MVHGSLPRCQSSQPIQQKSLSCTGCPGHRVVSRVEEEVSQGEVVRVRLREENATKNPVPNQSGHHGPHVAQHVDQVYRPEPMEGELRRGTVPQRSVEVAVSIYFLMIEVLPPMAMPQEP